MTAGGSFREAASRILLQRLSSTGRDLTYTQSYPHRWITTVASRAMRRDIRAGLPAHWARTAYRDDGCGTVAHASKTLQALRRELRWLTVRRVLSTLGRFDEWHEERVHEADVSTESTAAREDARVSRAHDHEGRAQGAQASPCQGSQTAHGVAGRFPRRERLTTSAEFQALFQRGRRIDRPALIVLWREATEPTRVGFAVSRQVKNAVQRNRARRRLARGVPREPRCRSRAGQDGDRRPAGRAQGAVRSPDGPAAGGAGLDPRPTAGPMSGRRMLAAAVVGVPAAGVPVSAAGVPLRADVLGVRAAGAPRAWRDTRDRAGPGPTCPM